MSGTKKDKQLRYRVDTWSHEQEAEDEEAVEDNQDTATFKSADENKLFDD